MAASSKLHRPAGDRIKTDARDALHLARLLRLDEVVSVRVPTQAEEPDRDLVRTREAARQDLMRSRHRVSKLLLRNGIVNSDGKAWTELHDRWRFTGAGIGAYLGLVPSEHSPGQSRAQGAINKTGNAHVRRLLVEAAWHHRTTYHPGAVLRRRWDQAPAAARARGHAGNQRLHTRWVNMNLRKKKPVIANVAVARELAGWCWSLAVMPD